MKWRIAQWNSATWWGGAEVRLVELCEALRKRGHFVLGVVSCPSRLWSELQRQGFAVEGRAPQQAGNLWRAMTLGLRLRRWGVSLLHAHIGRDYVPALVAGRIAKCPVVIHRHRYLPLKPLTRRLVHRWAAAVVAVSERVAQTLLQEDRLPSAKVQVIPMGIHMRRIFEAACHPDAIHKVRQELCAEGRRLILSVANLFPKKGHETLLFALASLRRQGIDAILAIAGEGPDRQRLEALAARLELKDKVHLLGYRDDVPLLLHAADCFALLSEEDACPGAVIEAMAAQRPIVVGAIGGIKELVAGYPAVKVVPPKDSAAIAEALKEMLSRSSHFPPPPSLRTLDIEETVSRLEQLYAKVVFGEKKMTRR